MNELDHIKARCVALTKKIDAAIASAEQLDAARKERTSHIVMMRDDLGMSFDSIGAQVDLSKTQVSSLYYRAKGISRPTRQMVCKSSH